MDLQDTTLIELTGWTFGTLDAQPSDRLHRMITVIGIRNRIERQKSRRHKRTAGGAP